MFSTLQLRTKLISGFLLVSMITFFVGVFGVLKLHQLNDADTILYRQATVPLGEVSALSTDMLRLRLNTIEAVDAKQEKDRQVSRDAITKLRESITKGIETFEKHHLTDEEKTLLTQMKDSKEAYFKLVDRVLEYDAAEKDAEAQALLAGEGRTLARSFRDAIDKTMEMKVQRAKAISEDNDAQAQSSAKLMYALIALGLMGSIGLGLLLTANVMNQLGEDPGYLAEVAGKIASGDLDVAFRPQKKEGGVYFVMRGMVQTMKDKIAHAETKTAEAAEQARLAGIATTEANEAKARAERAKAEGMMEAAQHLEKVVEVISSASEELSAQVEQSSRGTEVQSQRVGETATAMEEMNATVLEVAKNASQAADSSATARTKATDGAQIVSQVVAGINTMQTVSLTMKEDMGVLGKQAEGIGQVMNVISDIADQTNLLALNAAIEAARAGDAGGGSPWLADEVRKLAEKTMVATKQVGDAISGIQHGTKKNLENVERAVSTVEEATGLARQSGDALQEIVSLVEVSTDQVRSIAAASEEQSAASEEINRSIDEINRISTETATAMNQSAQAVGELANQAGNLRGLIDKMKSGA